MIKAYLRTSNMHYRKLGCNEHWDPDDNSDALILLCSQILLGKRPAKRSLLHNKIIVRMKDLAETYAYKKKGV